MPIGRALLASSGRELWPRPASVRAITRPNAPTASAEPNLQLTHSSSRHPALQRSCLACPCVCDSHPAATAPARPKPAVPQWPLPVRAWCAHTSARLAYLGLIARRVTARAPSMLSLRHQPRCVSRKKARRLQPTSAQSRTLSLGLVPAAIRNSRPLSCTGRPSKSAPSWQRRTSDPSATHSARARTAKAPRSRDGHL